MAAGTIAAAVDNPADWSFAPAPGDLEPFELGSGERGILLIHGFCGTPPEVRSLGEHLAAAGYRVHGALLAGHGATPETLERTGWQDWVASAQAQLDALRQECATVCVAGQSMGGALSLLLAARNPDVAAATMAALVTLGRFTETQVLVGRRFLRWYRPNPNRVDLWDREGVKKLRNYARRSMKSHVDLMRLYQEARRSLPAIKQPVLVMHGLRDGTVPPYNARLIAGAIGENATVRMFERSGHAMTVDVDAPAVEEAVREHFDAATAAPPLRAR